MIVQRRGERVRLFTQHDHGLLSGELAAAWKDPTSGDRLDAALILAVTLHDLAWRELDHMSLHNDKQDYDKPGIPLDFLSWPEDEKIRIYGRGISELAQMHPWAGLLLSRHYSSFVRPEDYPAFHDEQHALRDKLRVRAASYDAGHGSMPGDGLNGGLTSEEEGTNTPRDEERDFQLLRFLDVLSLVVCICEPGADSGACPVWLRPDVIHERFGYRVAWLPNAPEKASTIASDVASNGAPAVTLTVDPFPFVSGLDLRIPWREVPALEVEGPEKRTSKVSESESHEKAEAASRGYLNVSFRPL